MPSLFPVHRPIVAALLALAFAAAGPATAQETVVPETTTRIGYAQVLGVQPVYQTLRATRMEEQCEGEAAAPKASSRGLARIVDAVKGALAPAGADPRDAGPTSAADCRMVPVQREFKRPIAYDVDYVYKGMKYRSRLPYDPGNRLRIEFSLTPYVPPADER